MGRSGAGHRLLSLSTAATASPPDQDLRGRAPRSAPRRAHATEPRPPRAHPADERAAASRGHEPRATHRWN